MKLVFAGTPEAALPSLRALLDSRHEVAAVLTRPDAPTGRGRKVAPSAVARHAAEAGLEVLEPRRANDPDFLARLRQIGPDCCPVVAYGALLRPEALVIPPYGWVNLHFSVLPAWRGAGPVQAAIRAGDDITGASTFRIVQDLDAGPVFGTVTEAIRTEDTAGNLIERLADSGARLLLDTLDGIESGALTPREQPAEGASYAPKVTADNARVDWNVPAAVVERGIRAHTPDPGAWATFRGERVKLGPVEVDPREVSSVEVGTQMPEAIEEAAERAPEEGPGSSTDEEAGRDPLGPGEIRARKHSVHVGTATAPVRLRQVQPKGKRPMAAEDWARGVRPADGESLG